MKGITFDGVDGTGLRIGIVKARWNSEYTDSLVTDCKSVLEVHGVDATNIVELEVPGSYEVVYGAKHLINTANVDAVIAVGVLIKGETMHFEYIADAVSNGLMELNVTQDVPVIFGVLTCFTEEQTRVRSIGQNNHGGGWGLSAIEMARLKKKD